MTVQVHPVALFAISDHVSRKSPFKFGILVGSICNSTIAIHDAFELKTDSGDPDLNYVSKRLDLLLAVTPNLRLVGIYTINPDISVNPIPQAIWLKFESSSWGIPPVYATTSKERPLEMFNSSDGSLVDADISSAASETIATSTMKNHPHYTTEESELIQKSEGEIALSLQQMKEKIDVILSLKLTPDQENQVVYLTNKLASFEEPPTTDDSLQLLASRLSILTNQLLVSRASRAHFTPSGVDR